MSNLYFLVEGRRTEAIVYPEWFKIILSKYSRVRVYYDAIKQNYYLFNCNGFPSILNDMENAILDLNSVGKYGYLIILVDADDLTVDERIKEIEGFIQERKLKLENYELKIFVQNKCFETWFLGNRFIYKENPSSKIFRELQKHYNVKLSDPELMELPLNQPSNLSISNFHVHYLKEMLKERNLNYSKSNPKVVSNASYLNQLILRKSETNHMTSFTEFVDFLDKMNT